MRWTGNMLTQLVARGVFGARKVMFEALGEMMGKYDIHPVIGKVFEWEDAKKAFQTMNEGSEVGKIVIKV